MTESHESSVEQRRGALARLIRLGGPVQSSAAGVRSLPWDSAQDLVVLCAADVVRLLQAVDRGEVSERDVTEWAETLEGREDVGFDPANADALRDFLFAAANPELAESVVSERAVWIKRFSSSG